MLFDFCYYYVVKYYIYFLPTKYEVDNILK